jgi:hypothetical protein
VPLDMDSGGLHETRGFGELSAALGWFASYALIGVRRWMNCLQDDQSG